MEKLIYQNFPELLTYCKQGIPNWMIRLLIKYPGVSSVYNSGAGSVVSVRQIGKVRKDGIDQSVAGMSGSRMHCQAGRFVNYQQVIIFIEDFYRDGFRE